MMIRISSFAPNLGSTDKFYEVNAHLSTSGPEQRKRSQSSQSILDGLNKNPTDHRTIP